MRSTTTQVTVSSSIILQLLALKTACPPVSRGTHETRPGKKDPLINWHKRHQARRDGLSCTTQDERTWTREYESTEVPYQLPKSSGLYERAPSTRLWRCNAHLHLSAMAVPGYQACTLGAQPGRLPSNTQRNFSPVVGLRARCSRRKQKARKQQPWCPSLCLSLCPCSPCSRPSSGGARERGVSLFRLPCLRARLMDFPWETGGPRRSGLHLTITPHHFARQVSLFLPLSSPRLFVHPFLSLCLRRAN